MSTNYSLKIRHSIEHNSGEILCVKFSPDGKHLLTGCGDGSIRIYNTKTGKEVHKLQDSYSIIPNPVISIKFRPNLEENRNKNKNILISTNTAGTTQQWNLTSYKCIYTSRITDGEQLYCVDYDTQGQKFVTAGKDKILRLYDEETKKLVCTMEHGIKTPNVVNINNNNNNIDNNNIDNNENEEDNRPTGHSNRIFACKFHPIDVNTIITGGWDRTLQIWDIREGKSVRKINGPFISGEGLDINHNGLELLTGSWRANNSLEIYDYRQGKKLKDIPWNGPYGHGSNINPPTLLYSSQYSKEGENKFICAGGSGYNELKVFDQQDHHHVIGSIHDLNGAIFTVDFSNDIGSYASDEVYQTIACGGSDSTIKIIDIVNKHDMLTKKFHSLRTI
eukprot:TRINITY_DN66241_c12_g1_i1.p1 TRINITY_DN66241_c12_g1~~TRINITY_DN66241_c12_g1_i1.p1  ORF type:complete len:391 (+),score=-17.72 TRINITY_DN66241_c12_g1_i1:69-1241(+)